MAEMGRVPPEMRLCRGCLQFVWPETEACRFCGGDLAALERSHEERQAALRDAMAELKKAVAARGG